MKGFDANLINFSACDGVTFGKPSSQDNKNLPSQKSKNRLATELELASQAVKPTQPWENGRATDDQSDFIVTQKSSKWVKSRVINNHRPFEQSNVIVVQVGQLIVTYSPKKDLPFAFFLTYQAFKSWEGIVSKTNLAWTTWTLEWKQTKIWIFKMKCGDVFIVKCVVVFHFNQNWEYVFSKW